MAAPLVDIVYVNRNRARRLEESLGSVRGVASRLVGRVTVVDSGSRLEESGHLAHLPADVDVIRTEGSLGFARSANLGARRGEAPHLLFLCPDSRLLPSTLPGLLDELAGRGGRALVGPRRFADASCTLTLSPVRPPAPCADTAQRLLEDGRLREASLSWLERRARLHERNEATRVRALSGAALAVGRAAFDELGGFDEAGSGSSEDAELCRRAARRGIPSVYLPAVAVVQRTERASDLDASSFAPHGGPLARAAGRTTLGGVACLRALRKRRGQAEAASLDTLLERPAVDAGRPWAVELGRSPLFADCLTAFPDAGRFPLAGSLGDRLPPGIYYARTAVREEPGGWRERRLLRLTKVEAPARRPTLVQGVVA